MTTDARAIRTHESVLADWESVKEWAKSKLTKQTIRETALCAATVTLMGVVVFSLHEAMEGYIILGF